MDERKEEEGFIVFSMKSDKAQYDSIKSKQDLLLTIISRILYDKRDINISFIYKDSIIRKDVDDKQDEPYLFEEKELFEKGNKNEI